MKRCGGGELRKEAKKSLVKNPLHINVSSLRTNVTAVGLKGRPAWFLERKQGGRALEASRRRACNRAKGVPSDETGLDRRPRKVRCGETPTWTIFGSRRQEKKGSGRGERIG